MAKGFDIYLRGRIFECDLIVQSIPYYDGISATTRLVLMAALNDYTFQKFLAVQAGSKLTAHIDDMIKTCLEKLSIGVGVNASALFRADGIFYPSDAPLVIDTPAITLTKDILIQAENGIVLAAKPLETEISTSTGRCYFPLAVGAEAEISKHDLLNVDSPLVLKSEAAQVDKTSYIWGGFRMDIDAGVKNLCYASNFDASNAVEIVSLLLATDYHHSLGSWSNGITIGVDVAGASIEKFIIAQAVIAVMQEAVFQITKIMYPNDAAISLVPSAEFTLQRYRLLSDIDDLTLEDIDDMTLEELDWIEVK